MPDHLMQIVDAKFMQIKSTIQSHGKDIDELREKTERAGEADGFRQYTFAELPFAVDGISEVRFAFVTDGLDVTETAGNGTGCLAVYKPSLDAWRRVADNTNVAS